MKRVLNVFRSGQGLGALGVVALLSGCISNGYGLLGMETIPPEILHTGFYEVCAVSEQGAPECIGASAVYVTEYQDGAFLMQSKPEEVAPTEIKLNRMDSDTFALQKGDYVMEGDKWVGKRFLYVLAVPKNGGLMVWSPECSGSVEQAWAKRNGITGLVKGLSTCEIPNYVPKAALFDLLKASAAQPMNARDRAAVSLFYMPISESRGLGIWTAEAKKK